MKLYDRAKVSPVLTSSVWNLLCLNAVAVNGLYVKMFQMLPPFQASGCLFQNSVWSTAMSFKCINNPNKVSSDISPLVQRLTLKMIQKFCERVGSFG